MNVTYEKCFTINLLRNCRYILNETVVMKSFFPKRPLAGVFFFKHVILARLPGIF